VGTGPAGLVGEDHELSALTIIFTVLAAVTLLPALLGVLVPAAMHLFGDANWWLPRGLDRRLPIWPSSPRRPPRPPHLFRPPRFVNSRPELLAELT